MTGVPDQNPFILHRLQPGIADFVKPIKQINDGEDLTFFLTSTAYRELKIWILQLSRACLPYRENGQIETHQLDDHIDRSPAVRAVSSLLDDLRSFIEHAPPDTGPRRFGNVSFRLWIGLLEKNIDGILAKHMRAIVGDVYDLVSIELKAYIMESFGSAQRLDYGTGHELNFLAFLGGLWKLGVFIEEEQWAMITCTIKPYLELTRHLIKTYTLEPAGSHGVWGLDDHHFIPYILGSAQLAPPLQEPTSNMPFAPTPVEGSVDIAPDPASIMSPQVVAEQQSKNFYFAAIGFILDVKKGPFFEHSPYLYNISGIKDGWGKINKGMLKMYDAEVLGKFPVVQHFPFGSLWQWTQDPAATAPATSVHRANVARLPTIPPDPAEAPRAATETQLPASAMPATRAPWAVHSSSSSYQQMLPPQARIRTPGQLRSPGAPRTNR